jgi:hypothetical protein
LIDSDAAAAARCAALSALEGVDDRRVVAIARRALATGGPAVAVAAVGVLRGWLTRETGTQVLDALAAVALGTATDARLRQAALDALSELPRELVQPILDQQPSRASVAFDDPAAAREWVSARGGDSALSELHDAIVQMRAQEQADSSALRRQEWQAARAAAHGVLARRDSRIALYDLRETFESARRALPLELLTAITTIGDASCLEPLARAWAACPHDTWWREHLAAAAQAIVHRIRLSGRSAAMKRIRAEWPGFI